MFRIPLLLTGLVLASALSGCAGQSSDGPPSSTPKPSLSGTWVVTALVGSDGKSLLTGPFADRLRMTFTDGQMSGNSGCNSIFGPYRLDGDDLIFTYGQMGTTLVGCDEPPLLQRLREVRHLSGEGDVRYLQSASRATIVELRRA